MIDSTKAPMSQRRRAVMTIGLAILVVVAGYVLWTKDFNHHSSTGSAGVAPAPAVVQSVPSKSAGSPATTIPGGPESNRNPFAAG